MFGTSNNKLEVGEENLSGYSGSASAATELGNNVAFSYHLLANPTDKWQTILAEGFFTNTAPIHGMEGISITKTDTNASVSIYWSNISIFSEGRYEVFAASTNPISFDFYSYKPNYIKVVALGSSLNIDSVGINFSCSDENPLVGGGTKTVLMGTYPQSKVTDSALITTLNTATGALPTSGNNQLWTDYGYYISGSVSSYMWYIDITNATDEYRGVYFTSYRPSATTYISSATNSYQDNNGYATSSAYWFKYEPITWRVLNVVSSKAFLMANLVIDSQDYYYSTANRTIGGATVYPNNYMYSHIRSWLNTTFYNTAFTTEEKARIQTTTVDNSAASAGYGVTTYACANTSDKVFLLSYLEATNATYGLNTTTSRMLKPSAYAQSQGVYTYTSNGNSYWALRSPFYMYAYDVQHAYYDGTFSSGGAVNTNHGVAPALWISL